MLHRPHKILMMSPMSAAEAEKDHGRPSSVPLAPRGMMILLALGPGLMWCGEYIGSGEVILSTRAGAIYGVALLWVPTIAIFAKFWIGLAGAHYTVTTGEGMIDMMGRMPETQSKRELVRDVWHGSISLRGFR
jgi:hypothetical protein